MVLKKVLSLNEIPYRGFRPIKIETTANEEWLANCDEQMKDLVKSSVEKGFISHGNLDLYDSR